VLTISPDFARKGRRLREEGQAVAKEWLADWRARGKDFASYPNDARYPEPA